MSSDPLDFQYLVDIHDPNVVRMVRALDHANVHFNRRHHQVATTLAAAAEIRATRLMLEEKLDQIVEILRNSAGERTDTNERTAPRPAADEAA